MRVRWTHAAAPSHEGADRSRSFLVVAWGPGRTLEASWRTTGSVPAPPSRTGIRDRVRRGGRPRAHTPRHPRALIAIIALALLETAVLLLDYRCRDVFAAAPARVGAFRTQSR